MSQGSLVSYPVQGEHTPSQIFDLQRLRAWVWVAGQERWSDRPSPAILHTPQGERRQAAPICGDLDSFSDSLGLGTMLSI